MSDEFWKRVPNWLIGVGLIAIAMVVSIQMYRGDALVCASGAIFSKSCNEIATAQIPTGIVVASMKRCADLGGGWKAYDVAAGRVIVGVGTARIDGFSRTFLFDEQGGYWEHVLTENQMPPHRHELTVGQHSVGGKKVTAWSLEGTGGAYSVSPTGSNGRGEAHNNMPPYIALFYCVKDS